MDEIDIFDNSKKIEKKHDIPLPVNFLSIGEIDKDCIQVYIKQDIYKEIETYSKSDTSKEIGGILIGDCIDTLNKKNVIISAYIEAKYTDASSSTLTFTHETWDYIHKNHQRLYPNQKIVGWHHTHPSFGIFLSNYDIFIQENFFNLPWQVAYVVDPIENKRGFFKWENNKISKTNGFYLYDDIGKKIEIEIQKSKSTVIKSFSLLNTILLITIMIMLILTISFGMENTNIKEKLDETLSTLNISKQNTAETITKANIPNIDTATFKKYKIQKNDTLELICKNAGIDYKKSISTVLKINNIKNENKIFEGQLLYLPID